MKSAQRVSPRGLDRLVGTHQILKRHFTDAVSAHLAAKPFSFEVGESARIFVLVKGVQNRPRRCDGPGGEFKIGRRDHQFILDPVLQLIAVTHKLTI